MLTLKKPYDIMFYVKQLDVVQIIVKQYAGDKMREKRYIGIEIRAVDNLLKRFIDNQISKMRAVKMTGSNGWIIDYLVRNLDRPIYQKDLEQEFKITRSTASKVLNLMEEKGFIIRESVSEDARLKKLVVTPKAVKIAKEIEANREVVEAQIIKGFSNEELEQFYSYLERVKKNVSDV